MGSATKSIVEEYQAYKSTFARNVMFDGDSSTLGEETLMLKNKMKIYHIDFVCRKSSAIQFNSISKGPSEHSHFRSGREIRKVIIFANIG